MEGEQDGQRWDAHPLQAGLLRGLAFLVPLVASVATGLLVASWLPPTRSFAAAAGCWVVVIAASTAAMLLVDRLTRRLLPIATLLKLSMLFPDQAPSRFKVARSAAGTRALASELEQARERGLRGDRQQVAETVLALVGALGDYDSRTRGHSERTQLFVTLLADQLRLKQGDRDRLLWAALVHDIGKLEVPSAVLNKPGKPDADEWAQLQRHPVDGAAICAPLADWLGPWVLAVEEHHERYDGSGYPAGLRGEQISLAGRVVAVADAYEVMTAARPYKKPMSAVAAREELARCAGTHFDPVVVRAFLHISLGRLRWAAGPLSWLSQLPFVRPLPSLGEVTGVLASAAATAAALVAVGLAPVLAGGSSGSAALVTPSVPAPAPLESAPSPRPPSVGDPTGSTGPLVFPVVVRDEDAAEPSAAPPSTAPAVTLVYGPPTNPAPAATGSPVPPAAPAPAPVPPPVLGPVASPAPAPSSPDPVPDPVAGPSAPSPNVAPSPGGDALVLAEDSEAGLVDVLANDWDEDGDVLTVVALSGAQRGTTTLVDGVVHYRPAPDHHGSDAFTYTVSDGRASREGSVAVTVTPVEDAPVAAHDTSTLAEDSPAVVLDVLTNDVDADGDQLVVDSVTQPAHGVVELVDGVVTYRPAADYAGPDAFAYVVRSGDATDTADVALEVSPLPDPPMAGADVLVVDEDAAAAAVHVLADDVDADGDLLSVASVSSAGHGTTALVDGVVTYAPGADWSGRDSFTYVLSAGGDTATGSVEVTVMPVDDAPTAVADAFTVLEDSAALSLDVLANDTDPDSSGLGVAGYTSAANGTVSLSAGVLSYTPAAHASGVDSFSYTVTDGSSSSTATVTMTVQAQPDAPSAADDSYSAVVGGTVSGNVLSNDSDEDGGALTVVAGDHPVGPDGAFSYPATVSGVFSFTYVVSDGALTGTATVTITVTAQPVVTSGLYLRGVGGTAVGALTEGVGSDPAADWDGDGKPGTTLRSSGMKPDESDTSKLRWWSYPVPDGGMGLNGPVSLQLSSSTEGKDKQDLDYAAWLYSCAADGTGCVLLASTVDVHVDSWSSTTTWEQRTVGVGTVNQVLPAGSTLRLGLSVNHSDLWLALDAAHPSALLLTTGGG